MQIGIDIGSTFTKYCVMEEGGRIRALWSEGTPVRQQEYFREKTAWLRREYGGAPIVTCGYGRRNAPGGKAVTELTALAAGAALQCPAHPVILDIGGQDTKLIRQENGRLKAFFVNDKCAAGCGMFLVNTLRLLQKEFTDISLAEGTVPPVKLSSVCAVFAQTEIVRLIAEGVPEEGILQAVLAHIFTQAKVLLGKTCCEEVALSGGLSQIRGIAHFAGEILGKPVVIPDHGAYLAATGCACLSLGEVDMPFEKPPSIL